MSMTTAKKNRIESVDLLKGLVMVIMAIDHTRDYFHQSPDLLDLTDPARTTIPIYITRWITHFCAPTFSFLAGISAFMVSRKKSENELSIFLITRGLWLVFIELTIISFAWYLDIQFRNFDLAVIWCLGISMIFLAAIIHLPRNLILILSCVLIFGHNTLDTVHFKDNLLWSILHEFGNFKLSDTRQLNVFYPIIPWIGVMALGYYFGSFYTQSFSAAKRRKLFNRIGIASILLFVIMRWINIYGDTLVWKKYDTIPQTIMSFMNITKYPPSLLYLLVTLSVALIVLANTEKLSGKVVDFFTTFGRVPFFYYILHLYAIRVFGMIFAELSGYDWQIMIQTTPEFDLKGFGYNLGTVYLIWAGIILLLYPLCKKFDSYKQSHKEKWWLSYL
ncbi:DUF1624 domain-containing protein [Emticicia sp. BO119]|uniref:DUF1624 domain-containing protein n=1 Tax=Emticicia sp. BO119 TaxID=2757768 RepID=UPI0015EFDDD1|nr:heparan-alpha-glucosaminide N-acetyltransferase domain-containing protein [Emticicia sp. BO119]MBA4852560.1 DUF1624 domain-containing protein [Emticicia sp. BO119]